MVLFSIKLSLCALFIGTLCFADELESIQPQRRSFFESGEAGRLAGDDDNGDISRLPRLANPSLKASDLSVKRPIWIDLPPEADPEVDVLEKRRINTFEPELSMSPFKTNFPKSPGFDAPPAGDPVEKSAQLPHDTKQPLHLDTLSEDKLTEFNSTTSNISTSSSHKETISLSDDNFSFKSPFPFGVKPDSGAIPASPFPMDKEESSNSNYRSGAEVVERSTPKPWLSDSQGRDDFRTNFGEGLPSQNYEQFRSGAARAYNHQLPSYPTRTPTTSTTTTTTARPSYRFEWPTTTRPSYRYDTPTTASYRYDWPTTSRPSYRYDRPGYPSYPTRMPTTTTTRVPTTTSTARPSYRYEVPAYRPYDTPLSPSYPDRFFPKTSEEQTTADPYYYLPSTGVENTETPVERQLDELAAPDYDRPQPSRAFPPSKKFIIDPSQPDSMAPMREYLNYFRREETSTTKSPPPTSFQHFTIDTSKPGGTAPMFEYINSQHRAGPVEDRASGWDDSFPWRSETTTRRPAFQQFQARQPYRRPDPIPRFPARKMKRNDYSYMPKEADLGSGPTMSIERQAGPDWMSPEEHYICSLNNGAGKDVCRSVCGERGHLVSCAGPYCYCTKPAAPSTGEVGQSASPAVRCGPNTEYGRSTCRMVCPNEEGIHCAQVTCYCQMENMAEEDEFKEEPVVDVDLERFTVNSLDQYVYCGPASGNKNCGQYCNGWNHVSCGETSCYCDRKTY